MVWSVDREAGFDLTEFAYDVLENAKDSLRNDGFLEAGAFVLTDQRLYCFSVGFEGPEQKFSVYARLVEKAKELGATAIVILNDAYWGENYDPASYYQGKLAEEGRECVLVAVAPGNEPTWALQAKYRRVADSIVFEPTEKSEGDRLFLLGSWSKEFKQIQ